MEQQENQEEKTLMKERNQDKEITARQILMEQTVRKMNPMEVKEVH